MHDRQRYHLIVKSNEFIGPVRDLLEQSSLTDIRVWKSFPLLFNVSLTKEQAEWFRTHDLIQYVEQVQNVYLHEEALQYEIKLLTSADAFEARKAILAQMDVTVTAYESIPQSLFVRLDTQQLLEFSQNVFPVLAPFWNPNDASSFQPNISPVKEFSRVLNLQRFNWGLERVLHRTTKFFETVRLTRNGSSTRVFVVDTGVQSNHDELRGRVSSTYRYDAFRSPVDPLYGEPSTEIEIVGDQIITDDHGTHVASLIAGSTVGIAPAAEVISVRAFSNFERSTTLDLVNAIDWVIQTQNTLSGPAVVNMSLAFTDRNIGTNNLGSLLVATMINAGLTVVVSAGNNGSDAFFTSPANATSVRNLVSTPEGYELRTTSSPVLKPIVVGASVQPRSTAFGKDEIWSQSNWGDLVDLYAPGVNIFGASLQVVNEQVDLARTGSYELKTGTSCSAPIVAGIALLHLENNPNLVHNQVRKLIIDQATKNAFDSDQVRHDRVDPPRYIGSTPVVLTNPTVFSPNRLAYAWFTNTDITWDQQDYDFSVDENDQTSFSLSASSSDFYRDEEVVDYNYFEIDEPIEFTVPNFAVFFKSVEFKEQIGNFIINTNTANFRINAPTVTGPTSGTYLLEASDGRMTSSRRFKINVNNVPKAPVWQTPMAGPILTEIIGGQVVEKSLVKGDEINQTSFVFQASHEDNLPITYSFSPFDGLPPGLRFVNDPDNNQAYLKGRIYQVPYSNEINRYEFLVRATASNGKIAERLFTLSTKYTNELHEFTPTWYSALTVFDPDNYPGVKNFGKAYTGNSYFKTIQVTNPDLDPLEFTIDFVPSVSTSSGVFNGALPAGLGINSSGEIQGIVDLTVSPGLYFFRVKVVDLNGYEIFEDFVIQLEELEDNVQESNQIDWITPAGKIGNIYETFASHLQVEARNPEGKRIKYSLSPNSFPLPDGLYLDSNTGMIIGLTPYVPTTLNFDFIVRASLGERFVDRNFSLTVVSQYQGLSVMSFKANVMGRDRLTLRHWLVAKEIIPEEDVFRATDPNFGMIQQPHMYVLSGANVAQREHLMDYLSDYHKRMFLVIGKTNWAPAYDLSGEYLYDVIYMEVTDPNEKAGGFDAQGVEQTLTERQSKPAQTQVWDPVAGSYKSIWDEPTKRSRYFPSTLKNVRTDLVSINDDRLGLGLAGNEGLPLWMRTKNPRDRNRIVGFTPAIVLGFVKPNRGRTVVSLLARAGFDQVFSGTEFILDRYYVSDISESETKFDVTETSITEFDNPLFDTIQGDDVSMLDFRTRFDVATIETGKYYKFEDDLPIIKDRPIYRDE
jgi:subtilisin family serine protease